jgi:hypothetical protein
VFKPSLILLTSIAALALNVRPWSSPRDMALVEIRWGQSKVIIASENIILDWNITFDIASLFGASEIAERNGSNSMVRCDREPARTNDMINEQRRSEIIYETKTAAPSLVITTIGQRYYSLRLPSSCKLLAFLERIQGGHRERRL